MMEMPRKTVVIVAMPSAKRSVKFDRWMMGSRRDSPMIGFQ